jgi:hypothetical protein
MNTNTIPKSSAEVMSLALLALSGLRARGPALGVAHNSADKLETEIFALSGNPAAPLIPGATECPTRRNEDLVRSAAGGTESRP